MRKFLKIFFYGIAFSLLLAGVGHFLLQYRARQVIRLMVNSLSNGHYQANAGKVTVGYFPFSVRMHAFTLKQVGNNREKLEINTDSIHLSIGSIKNLLLHRTLQVSEMKVSSPRIVAAAVLPANAKQLGSQVSNTLAAIQAKLFETFDELAVDNVDLQDASIKILDSSMQKTLLSVNHIHLRIVDFNLAHLQQSGEVGGSQQVILEMRHPDIRLADSSLQVSIGKASVDALKGNVNIDSLNIRYRSPQKMTEETSLSTISIRRFNWLRFLNEGTLEIDSVLVNHGLATLDLSGRDNDKDHTQPIVFSGNSWLIHHAAVSNVSYTIRTRDDAKTDWLSLVKLQGNSLAANEISLVQGRIPALDVKQLGIHVTNFKDADSTSKYTSTFSDLSIRDKTLTLHNYKAQARVKSRHYGDEIIIPELSIEQFSLDHLLKKRVVAERLVVKSPLVNATILPTAQHAPRSIKKIDESVEKFLDVFPKNILIQWIDVENAAFNLKPQDAPQNAMNLRGLTFRMNGRKALQANNLTDIIYSIEQLKTEGFSLSGNQVNLKLSGVQMLSEPHGFFFEKLQGQFGRGVMLDLRGVKIVNERHQLHLTRSDGLHAAAISVSGGNVRVSDTLKPHGDKVAHAPPPIIRADELLLRQIDFDMQYDGQSISAFASEINASDFALVNGKANFQTLLVHASPFRLQTGNTKLACENLQLVQPGVLIMHKVEGSTHTARNAANFASDSISVSLNIPNNDTERWDIQKVWMNAPAIRIKSLGEKQKQEIEVYTGGNKQATLKMEQLELQNPNIEWIKTGLQYDTLAHTQMRNGNIKLNGLEWGEDAGMIRWKVGKAQLQINDWMQAIKTGNTLLKFQPKYVNVQASGLVGLPSLQQIQGNIDTLQLSNFAHQIIGGNQDTVHLSFSKLGVANWPFNNMDTAWEKNLLLHHRWWATGGTLRYQTPGNTLLLQGVSAGNDKQVSFGFDSMRLNYTLERDAFWKQHPYVKDYITFATGAGFASAVKFNFDKGNPQVQIGQMKLDNLDLIAQRNRNLPDDTVSYRPLLAKQIASLLPLPLMVEKLNFTDGMVKYVEVLKKSNKESSIVFNEVKGTVLQLKTHQFLKEDSLNIHLQAMMYGRGKVKLNLRQSYADSLQAFRMGLIVETLPLNSLNPFLTPQIGVSIKSGRLDSLVMRVKGNDISGYGTMFLRYQKLSVQRLNKEGQEKFFLSNAQNWIISQLLMFKNDKKAQFFVKNRNRQKGTFNFITKLVEAGMLANLKINVDRKAKKNHRKAPESYPNPGKFLDAGEQD